MELGDRFERLAPIGGLSHNRDLGETFQLLTQNAARNRLIVYDQRFHHTQIPQIDLSELTGRTLWKTHHRPDLRTSGRNFAVDGPERVGLPVGQRVQSCCEIVLPVVIAACTAALTVSNGPCHCPFSSPSRSGSP